MNRFAGLLLCALVLLAGPAEAGKWRLIKLSGVTPPPTVPLVGPGAWNGTMGSGGAPSPVAETSAAPAVHWMQPDEKRLASDDYRCVDADAHGGVASVTFSGDVATTVVTSPIVRTYTDVNGVSKTIYPAYCINLNAAAYKLVSVAGGARIYATATPNNGAMQPRTIGYDLADNGLYNGDYPMKFYPRTAEYDWDKTICASGCDYTTLDAAITAARTATAEAPRLTFNTTGNYELTNVSRSPSIYTAGKGYMIVRAAAGVTATLRRAASFTTTAPADYQWTPGWDGIEFRGSGIKFDLTNWEGMTFSTRGPWFNGVQIVNPAAATEYYFNGGTPPRIYIIPNTAMAYFDDVTSSGKSVGLSTQRYVINSTLDDAQPGDILSGTHYANGVSVNTWNDEPYLRVWTDLGEIFYGLSVSYAPPGAQTTATIAKTSGDVDGSVTVTISGAAPVVIPISTLSSDTNPTINSLKTALEAIPGITATALNGRGLMRATTLDVTGAVNIFNTTASFTSGLEIHGDWFQGYVPDNTVRTNVILRNNIVRNAYKESSIVNVGDGNPGTNHKDHILKNNVWNGYVGSAGSYGGALMTHFVVENNSGEPYLTVLPSSDTTYSRIANNVFNAIQLASGSWSTAIPLVGNLYASAGGGGAIPNTGNHSGNTAFGAQPVSYTVYQGFFVNYVAGDYRPAPAGTLATTTKSRVNLYDGLNLPFAATDATGARSNNDPAP